MKCEMNPAHVWNFTDKYTSISGVMVGPLVWDVKLASHKNAHITTAY